MIQINFRLKYVCFLFVSIFFSLSSFCIAGQKLIAVTEVWPPFRISAAESEQGFTGIDIDILEKLEAYLDLEIDVQRHPFARALEMIRTNKADLIPGVAFTEERHQFILYVPSSYYAVTPVFYTRKGRGCLVQNYEDLYQFKIGYSLHSAYFEPFNSDDKLQKLGISTEEQLIKMLALGRIDVIIGTNPNIAWDIKRFGFKDKVEQTRYIPSQKTPVYIGLSKKSNNTVLQKKIDECLKKMINSGEVNQIINKYQ